MNNRTRCKCGCGASIAHRRLGTLWATEGCRKRAERGSVAQNADTTRTRSRSGLQVSYRKAVAVLQSYVEYDAARHGSSDPARVARDIAQSRMAEALSERQRERLR